MSTHVERAHGTGLKLGMIWQTSTYNKAFAIRDWFENGDGRTLRAEDVVVLLDGDMILTQVLRFGSGLGLGLGLGSVLLLCCAKHRSARELMVMGFASLDKRVDGHGLREKCSSAGLSASPHRRWTAPRWSTTTPS